MLEWFERRVARRGRGFEPHIPQFTVCVVTSTHSGLKHLNRVVGEGAKAVVAAAGLVGAAAWSDGGERQSVSRWVPVGGPELGVVERCVEVAADHRKRSAGGLAERDEEGREALDGTRRRKEARLEPELEIAVAASQDVVWGGDLPD